MQFTVVAEPKKSENLGQKLWLPQEVVIVAMASVFLKHRKRNEKKDEDCRESDLVTGEEMNKMRRKPGKEEELRCCELT